MDIPPLLDLACAKIAWLIYLRLKYNKNIIECDLTEEELKEYEEYQI